MGHDQVAINIASRRRNHRRKSGKQRTALMPCHPVRETDSFLCRSQARERERGTHRPSSRTRHREGGGDRQFVRNRYRYSVFLLLPKQSYSLCSFVLQKDFCVFGKRSALRLIKCDAQKRIEFGEGLGSRLFFRANSSLA